jgi:hypothetical protein
MLGSGVALGLAGGYGPGRRRLKDIAARPITFWHTRPSTTCFIMYAISHEPPLKSRSGRAFHLTGAAKTNRRPAALHNTQQRKINKTIVVDWLIGKITRIITYVNGFLIFS